MEETEWLGKNPNNKKVWRQGPAVKFTFMQIPGCYFEVTDLDKLAVFDLLLNSQNYRKVIIDFNIAKPKSIFVEFCSNGRCFLCIKAGRFLKIKLGTYP